MDDMKGTSGYCFTFGYRVFSLTSKKQDIVTQSTTKVEFIGSTVVVNQVLWVRKILVDLQIVRDRGSNMNNMKTKA